MASALRFVTNKVDEGVVTPITSRISNSIANPMVLSYVLWDALKRLTPQRARDLTRILTNAASNGLSIFTGEQGKTLGKTSKRLQDEMLQAIVTPHGKNVVLNAIATASKVAQAMNTPETKAATQQMVETTQSVIDFLASESGRKVVSTTGECISQFFAVAASPETAIFLAEVATNTLHALEAEALRKEDAKTKKEEEAERQAREQAEGEVEVESEHVVVSSDTNKPPETESETESTMSVSDVASSMPQATPRRNESTDNGATSLPLHVIPPEPDLPNRHERMASRSARIERDVLLKMGVNPELIMEFQRVIDTIRAEEEEREALEAQHRWDNERAAMVFSDDENEDTSFGLAFGEQTAGPRAEGEEEKEPEDLLIPQWHSDLVRDAVRRRHAAVEHSMNERRPFEEQAREMADALSRQGFEGQAREMDDALSRSHIQHGELTPSDVLACRAISKMITFFVAFLLLMLMISVTRRVIGF